MTEVASLENLEMDFSNMLVPNVTAIGKGLQLQKRLHNLVRYP